MLDIFSFLVDTVQGADTGSGTNPDALSLEDFTCGEVQPIFNAIMFVIRIIQIAVPFALVIWGSLDFFKALIAGDEKEMKAKRKPFISRLVAAIVILVMPWLVKLIARQITGQSEADSYWTCFAQSEAKIDFTEWQKKGASELNKDEAGS